MQKYGLVFTYLSTNRIIPLDVSSEQLMRAVRLFQPYREGPAQVKLEEDQVTWRDRKGLSYTVTSVGNYRITFASTGRGPDPPPKSLADKTRPGLG